MRSNSERAELIRERTKSVKRRERQRRNLALSGVSITVCLAAVVGFALYLPGVLNGALVPGADIPGAYGSIMASVDSIGYIIIGVFAFLLGVSVTLLCIVLRDRVREADEGGPFDGERNGAEDGDR